jgi:hypothetical protein
MAAAVVFDDDAGAGAEIGLEEGVSAAGIAREDVRAGLMETARERAILDDELDFEAW